MFDQYTINEITTFIARFDSVEALEPNGSTGNSYHIYHRIEAAYRQELDQEALMSMYYHFTRYEECLKQYRNRELHTGAFLYQKITAQSRSFDERVDAGMELLYRAMSAYHLHVNGKLDEAIEELDIAILHCEKQTQLTPFVVSSIQEQWLNKVRVYFRKGDMERVRAEAAALLHFSFTGIYQQDKAYVTEAMYAVPYDEQESMLMHILLNIVMGLQRVREVVGSAMEDEILSGLAAYLVKEVATPSCAKASFWTFQCLHAFYSGEITTFVRLLNNHFESFKTIHKKLQKILIHQFFGLAQQHAYDLTSLSNHSQFVDLVANKWGLPQTVSPLAVV
ncbi:hypothetical protein KTO58_18375 [Chitinophaga pendula]|uniref:hypothetical protein n=1 Tax=Chitinophaga TaxID=79328 RepID=UPI000BAED71B|nr:MULTISPECIES: hypothetical protein [Chitinophaga]ASZ11356.1 hypothetical protein CK934_10440 [Chitinophaga sp. MD30]UCJ05642.1 hypothetical protein KTO58_18375 [Chitinophaga pendula]